MALAVALLTLCTLLGACGSDRLEQAVKQALVSGDTTEVRFNQICELIQSNVNDYPQFQSSESGLNVEALQRYITEVGSTLRPPMNWDVMKYKAQPLNLTLYIERSGSMTPYDAEQGQGEMKRVISQIINQFPGAKVEIKIVNSGVYPYAGSMEQFLQSRNIYAATKGIGDASWTDFRMIFNDILANAKPGNVSILISDLIYSPANTKGVSATKILNEVNGLTTSIFAKHSGMAVMVTKQVGDYHGKYYPYNGQPFQYDGERPYYIMTIAPLQTLKTMSKDAKFKSFMELLRTQQSHCFGTGGQTVQWQAIPDVDGSAGRFRIDRNEVGMLTDCQPDRTTGQLCFTIAVNLDALQLPDSYITDVSHYHVRSANGFKISVKRITNTDYTPNNRADLEGMTHLITLNGKLATPTDEISISLPAELPAWVDLSTTADDTSAALPGFAQRTFGLRELLSGIANAYNRSGEVFNLSIKLQD